ncbi:MAG: DUF1800 domain-containing protein [Acidobacteria bacterium]|nr:DUF1800 domain-containing protein [Acidobacteriota bacterium]
MKATLFSPGRLVAAVVAVGLGVVVPLAGQSAPAADTDTVVHVLNRLGYGPRPGDVDRVRQLGVEAYIEQQLHPERLPDTTLAQRLTAFPTIGLSTSEIARDYYAPAEAIRRAEQQAAGRAGQPPTQPTSMAGDPTMMGQPAAPARQQASPELQAARQKEQQILQDLMQARMVRAVTSEHQLEETLVDFWFNHFNVFSGKGQVRVYLTEYEREAIRPHVLGNFRDMLGAVAESPAMLFYLDNFQNVDPKAAQRQADDTLARQQQAQARGRGRGGARQQTQEQREQQEQRLMQARNRGLNENYARELMELHTVGVDAGYTQADVIAVARAFTGWTIDRPRDGGVFQFNAQLHDNDPKVVMGTKITAGGKKDGEAVLDLLANHPATAKFIATKLARRFVSDEPPTSVVDRAAKVFLSTKGDLREVTRAIVTSPEFFSVEARRAKVKTPLEFVASAVRASGANVTVVAPLVQALRDQGMPLYGAQPPTGWGDTAEDWVNTGALLKRLNFAIELAGGRFRGVRVAVRQLAPDTSEATRDALVSRLIASPISNITRDTLSKAESPQHLIALTLGSPEFQKR